MITPEPAASHDVLSREDERQILVEKLTSRASHPGMLFLPTNSFYEQLSTEKGAANAVLELYRWLGSKPTSVQITFAKVTDLIESHHTITVPQYYRQAPYQLGACLTLHVIAKVLHNRRQTGISNSLIETASIESGMGLIILNGIAHKPTILEHWHKNHQNTAIPHILTTYSPRSYAQAVTEHAVASHHDTPYLTSQLTKDAIRLLPATHRKEALHHRPSPTIIIKRQRRARQALYRVIGMALLMSTFIALVLFIHSQKPYTPSKVATDQYQKTQLLSMQYEACVKKVKEQQDKYHQDDIFIEREISAQSAKCQSIRNQYNYEVGVYNSLLDEAK